MIRSPARSPGRILHLLVTLLLIAGLARASPEQWRHEWHDTDFAKTSLDDWSQIVSGGPPKDGIPAIDNPDFRRAGDVEGIGGREPVLTVGIEGAAPRAFPIRYLLWHEIVNDRVGGIPVAVTYCPLCNSGMTFDRRVGGRVLSFGVSGKLRHSDMIMYDRQTESWWQQAVGRGIVGDMTGVALRQVPSRMESWDQFRARAPQGLVMAEPDHDRAYGRTPYTRYDSAERPFLYTGEDPPHGINPLERVVRVGGRAWPLTRIRAAGGLREADVTISWEEGQASALDTARLSRGREVGSVRVRDRQGRDVAHDVMFAFAFDAFWPDGTWMVR